MSELLFNEIVMSDLQKMNTLVQKGWFGTTDFDEAANCLKHALSVYLEERDENCKKGEYLQKDVLAKGA